MRATTLLLALLFALPTHLKAQSLEQLQQCRWEMLTPTGDKATGRHENAFVEADGTLYLLAGRGVLPVDAYNPQSNSWEAKGKTPLEINHFQSVLVGDEIYIVCAMNGKYPVELPLENVYIYTPATDSWRVGDTIPAEHRRGGGGAVLYDGKIYIVAGIDYGHTSGTNNTFSCYDPATGEWQMLTRAPHIRDHFAAIVVDDKLYCIGGRNSSVHHPGNFGAFFCATVPEVDVYDFKSQKWSTLAEPLPYPSAAGGVVNVGDYIIYMGGENEGKLASNHTQCLDTRTNTWHELAPMAQGMHGSGAILHNNAIYWAAGSYKQGGSNLNTMQRMQLP